MKKFLYFISVLLLVVLLINSFPKIEAYYYNNFYPDIVEDVTINNFKNFYETTFNLNRFQRNQYRIDMKEIDLDSDEKIILSITVPEFEAGTYDVFINDLSANETEHGEEIYYQKFTDQNNTVTLENINKDSTYEIILRAGSYSLSGSFMITFEK